MVVEIQRAFQFFGFRVTPMGTILGLLTEETSWQESPLSLKEEGSRS